MKHAAWNRGNTGPGFMSTVIFFMKISRTNDRRYSPPVTSLTFDLNSQTILPVSSDVCNRTSKFEPTLCTVFRLCRALAVMRRVCVSVCLSVTFVNSVKTNKHIFTIFAARCMHKRDLCRHAVCVCVSRSCIVSKRIDVFFFTIG